MHNLTSLQGLELENCPSIVTFPEDGFPSNLSSLEIRDMKISMPLFKWGLQRFTSIRKLKVGGCSDVVLFPQLEIGMTLPASLTSRCLSKFPNLERLSSIAENLTSLERLSLSDCPKLKYFPEKGLPTSLLKLKVYRCPLIKERCRMNEGQYRHFIVHIPCISII